MNKTVITTKHDLELAQLENDWAFGSRKNDTYEQNVIEWFHERPGDVFLDVGARSGWHGFHASLAGYTPYFFEPAKVNQLIVESMERNSICGVLYPVALGDETRVLELVDTRTEFYEMSGEGEVVCVPCFRLDDLMSDLNGVVGCKVDVEGSELQVLEGFGDLVNMIDFLVVEHHPNSTDVDTTREYLDTCGFVELDLVERNQYLGFYEQ